MFTSEILRQAIRGGTRLPSECDYLQKYSSLWRLYIDNPHKRKHSAVATSNIQPLQIHHPLTNPGITDPSEIRQSAQPG